MWFTPILGRLTQNVHPLVKSRVSGQDTVDCMLEHLFGSKTRTKLLTLFLHNPDTSYYVRELTRLIDTQINAVRRELDNLTKIGMVMEAEPQKQEGKKKAGVRRKYYKMDPMFPLLNEIRQLMMKSHLLMERKLDQELIALGDVKYAALMGTFLGVQDAPVDLFMVGNIRSDAAATFVKKLETDLGFEVNFTCLPPNDFRYRKDVGDRFLLSILTSPKNVVIDTMNLEAELANE